MAGGAERTFLDDSTFVVEEDAAIGDACADPDTLAVVDVLRPILQQIADVLCTWSVSVGGRRKVPQGAPTHVAKSLFSVPTEHGTGTDGFGLGVIVQALRTTLLATSWLSVSV